MASKPESHKASEKIKTGGTSLLNCLDILLLSSSQYPAAYKGRKIKFIGF